jgi:hypothetical protein
MAEKSVLYGFLDNLPNLTGGKSIRRKAPLLCENENYVSYGIVVVVL